jgi:Ca-activated chloride channel family protein
LQEGSHDKKVLLIVSDGEDNKSISTLREVRETLAKSKVIVYTIGLMDDGFSHPGKAVLKQLAEGTGGTAFFPGSVEEVSTICRKIARDLRNQYTLGYRPSNRSWDGSWRKIAVDIRPPKDFPRLQFRTKQGYYAVPPIAASTARPTGTSLQN